MSRSHGLMLSQTLILILACIRVLHINIYTCISYLITWAWICLPSTMVARFAQVSRTVAYVKLSGVTPTSNNEQKIYELLQFVQAMRIQRSLHSKPLLFYLPFCFGASLLLPLLPTCRTYQQEHSQQRTPMLSQTWLFCREFPCHSSVLGYLHKL